MFLKKKIVNFLKETTFKFLVEGSEGNSPLKTALIETALHGEYVYLLSIFTYKPKNCDMVQNQTPLDMKQFLDPKT